MHKMKLFYILIFLLLFSAGAKAEIVKVTVLDGNFKEVKVISSGDELKKFNTLWESKIESNVKIRVNWTEGYKLDISKEKSSMRWLYHPGGWLMPILKKGPGLYQIKNKEEFNKLITAEVVNK